MSAIEIKYFVDGTPLEAGQAVTLAERNKAGEIVSKTMRGTLAIRPTPARPDGEIGLDFDGGAWRALSALPLSADLTIEGAV